MRRLLAVLAIGMVGALAALPSTRAETVEEFYRGKTIKMYVGTGAGGRFFIDGLLPP